jgi:hypothetical protein
MTSTVFWMCVTTVVRALKLLTLLACFHWLVDSANVAAFRNDSQVTKVNSPSTTAVAASIKEFQGELQLWQCLCHPAPFVHSTVPENQNTSK